MAGPVKPSDPNRRDSNQKGGGDDKKRAPWSYLSIVMWAVMLVFLLQMCNSSMENASVEKVPYSTFLQWVEEGQVSAVELTSSLYTFTLKEDSTALSEYVEKQKEAYGKGGWGQFLNQFDPKTSSETASAAIKFQTVPMPGLARTDLAEWLKEHGVERFETVTATVEQYLMSAFVNYVLPILLMVGGLLLLYRYMFKKMGSGGGFGGIGGVGKSNAKVYVEKKTGVTFKDVAGQDEAKESLEEIIDFLHNPGKYTAIGAKLPKGALLVGSPGTGKTLLAKAVAGEAGVPFFSISGSGFVEMFVGVGASRVRDLFQEAAKVAPCIIFIDEIDAIGKTRDSRFGGGNDEREQTLNQLLAEMDGFDPSKGIIVLAATNRPEVLDKALLRPGRFDRRITVDRPNLAGRLATLQVHTKKIRMAEDVDLNKVAQATAGCVGADLANTVNEAALRAVRHGRLAVNQEDLLASFEVVIAGAEKKGTVITEQEKKIIAYHEVGHALAAAKQKNAQPVTKITIVPHTEGTLGYTLHLPEEEKFLMSRDDILTEIRTLLAGRCAEELVFDTQTSGAANDIERATELARNLVARFGMSETFGMMALGSVQSQYLEGGYGMNCAQETFATADKEVVKLLQKCHDEARALLEENREMLDKIASYLFERETITGGQMMAILDGRDPDKEDFYGVPAKSEPAAIEPPAKHINIVSEPIPMPMVSGEEPDETEDKPENGGEEQTQA